MTTSLTQQLTFRVQAYRYCSLSNPLDYTQVIFIELTRGLQSAPPVMTWACSVKEDEYKCKHEFLNFIFVIYISLHRGVCFLLISCRKKKHINSSWFNVIWSLKHQNFQKGEYPFIGTIIKYFSISISCLFIAFIGCISDFFTKNGAGASCHVSDEVLAVPPKNTLFPFNLSKGLI